MGLAVKFKFILDGVEINPPVNWQSLQVLATFDQSSVQANITTEEFEFVNESAQQIKNYLLGGLTLATGGIFEGLPFSILAVNDNQEVEVFDGFLDFTTYEEISPVRVRCKVKKTSGLNQLDDRSRANSFGYLESIGFITDADYTIVPTVVEKQNFESDVAIMSLTLGLLVVQLIQALTEISKDINTASDIGASAIPLSIPAGAKNLAVNIALNVVYVATLLVQIFSLLAELKEQLVPRIRNHRGMRLRKMVEKASEYLGYNYDSNLPELDEIVYLPSKPNDNREIEKGIPHPTDFGYQLHEIYELINLLTNSKIQVDGDTIVQRSLNDPFWVKTSNFQVPDVLDEKIKYNNDDFKARTLVTFQGDLLDDWTIDIYNGTAHEVVVTPVVGEGSPNNLMRGLEEVSIPCALGNDKNGFNPVEDAFFTIFNAIDQFLQPIINTLNTVTSETIDVPPFASLITTRLGLLKVSQKQHGLPKLVVLGEDERIPVTHRQTFSASALYDKYHVWNSFVADNFNGQRRIFEEKTIPFGFSDFLKCINNSYFVTEDGRTGKIESIKWTLDSDTAIVDYWVQEVYTTNLKETTI